MARLGNQNTAGARTEENVLGRRSLASCGSNGVYRDPTRVPALWFLLNPPDLTQVKHSQLEEKARFLWDMLARRLMARTGRPTVNLFRGCRELCSQPFLTHSPCKQTDPNSSSTLPIRTWGDFCGVGRPSKAWRREPCHSRTDSNFVLVFLLLFWGWMDVGRRRKGSFPGTTDVKSLFRQDGENERQAAC